MRTDFTDAEDKVLVQIAFQFEAEGLRVTWKYVAQRMDTILKTGRAARELSVRLSCLKRTYGKFIKDFPPCFFDDQFSGKLLAGHFPPRPPRNSRAPARSTREPPPPHPHSEGNYILERSQCGQSYQDKCAVGATNTIETSNGDNEGCAVRDSLCDPQLGCADQVIACNRGAIVGLTKCTTDSSGVVGDGAIVGGGNKAQLDHGQAIDAVAAIFSSITPHDVRQQSGRTYGNAGEVLPPGVSRIIAATGPFRDTDVFLDIGAGVGNILAQVALSTDVRACIGIELRGDLVELGQSCMGRHLERYPRLRKVMLQLADVRDTVLSSQDPICQATIVFANIFLFEEDAKLVVLRELSAMLMARLLFSTSQFCPRHRSTCSNPFCKSWKLQNQLEVPCSWKSAYHSVFIYQKKVSI